MSKRPRNTRNSIKTLPQSIEQPRLRAFELENEALKSHITALLNDQNELRDTITAYQQSMSWRLTAPVRALRRSLFWLTGTPQEKIQFHASGVIYRRGTTPLKYELRSIKDLIRDASGSWIATGVDPQLEVRFIGGSLRRGWHILTLEAATLGVARQLSPEWYLDQELDRSTSSQGVLARDGLKFSVMFFSAKNIVGLRINPCFFRGKIGSFGVCVTPSNRFGAYRFLRINRKRLHNIGDERFGKNGPAWWRLTSSANLTTELKRLAEHPGYANFLSPDPSYELWMTAYEHRLTKGEVLARLDALPRKPVISLLLPVYNTEPKQLRACIESVLRQSYPYWELCIADDASTDDCVEKILNGYAAHESRIKVVFRSENGHISVASNSALELATGDYVGLLDHDDELATNAALEVATAISAHPNAKLIYSDEDKIDRSGTRREPHFKSDWNPDLLLSHNYIGHLCVFEHERLKACGGFRKGFEGSQDHDLLLRYCHGLPGEAIVHVPKVLYHWRAMASSSAAYETVKDYTNKSGLRSVREAVRQTSQSASVEAGLMPNSYRVRYPIPVPAPLVTLIIPTRDQLDLTRRCIDSILEYTHFENYEIIIVDNGSEEPETLDYFDQIRCDQIRVLPYDAPFNFSAINNFAVDHARGSILGFVNNDIEVATADWLGEMVSHSVREDVGCVGAKLYYSDGSIQHAGVILGLGGVAGHSHKRFPRDHPGYFGRLRLVQNLSAVTAACMLVRHSIFDQVGGFNEDDLSIAFNDVDFCIKVRELGYRNVWTPYAELFHHESASRGQEDTPEKMRRFAAEIQFMKDSWPEALSRDPYYSPNLTLDREDFSIAT